MPRTGPRTRAGKEITRLNAVRHGILSAQGVVPGVESEEEWSSLRAAVLDGLEPVGAIETVLAEQIFSITWRRRRITRYEAASIDAWHGRAPADLAKQRAYRHLPGTVEEAELLIDLMVDAGSVLRKLRAGRLPEKDPLAPRLCCALLDAAAGDGPEAVGDIEGLPPPDQLPEFRGWNGRLLAAALRAIALRQGADLETLYEHTSRYVASAVEQAQADLLALHDDLARLRRQRILPDERVLHTIIRYEAHLDRSFYRALHELQELQARRLGRPSNLARVEVYGLPGA